MEIFNTAWKVLIPIFQYPLRGLSAREIARMAGISHTATLKILKRFETEGIVKIEKRGKLWLVTAAVDNPEFIKLKKLYNLLSLEEFTGFLVSNYPIEVIILFGSYAEGRDTERSDIDVYVGYGEIRITEKDLKKFEEKLKRKIQIFTGNLKNFPKELKENILNGVKLWGWLKLDEL